MDLYQILEIKPTSSEIEIKKAYNRLVKIYHPDKNKSLDAKEKFQKIHSAYEILINDKSRQEYMKMTHSSQTSFVDILDQTIRETINIDEFKKYGINLDKIDFDYIQKNFMNFFKSINVGELLNFFKKGIVPKKKFNNIVNCSESELEVFDELCAEYYYNLPISIQKINPLDIRVDICIKLGDITNKNKRKLKIKRQVNNITETSTFIFDISTPYIVFHGAGDMDNMGNAGNMIIKLILPNNLLWFENLILIEQTISLYELIYGLDISLDIGMKEPINIKNWVPSRDGFFIELPKSDTSLSLPNLAIKLYLNYEDLPEKQQLLKQYFS